LGGASRSFRNTPEVAEIPQEEGIPVNQHTIVTGPWKFENSTVGGFGLLRDRLLSFHGQAIERYESSRPRDSEKVAKARRIGGCTIDNPLPFS
jgi:hypothetical protein